MNVTEINKLVLEILEVLRDEYSPTYFENYIHAMEPDDVMQLNEAFYVAMTEAIVSVENISANEAVRLMKAATD